MASSSKQRRLVHKAPPKLDEVRNEINVTPLVDVCLVLLIIFMVIGPMLARGKEVQLPTADFQEKSDDRLEPVVAIDRYGELWVEKDKVANLTELEQRLREEWDAVAAANAKTGAEDRSGEVRVLLKVDREVTYGTAYPIIIALHEIGAQGIDLGTAEDKSEQNGEGGE